MIRAALAFTIVALIVAWGGHALANPAVADKLAGEANDLAAKGLFKDAAAKFAAAYKEDPTRPSLFCNIGISYFKAGELPRAHLLLGQCLTRTALEKSFVDTANVVLKTIDDTLRASGHTPITVTVSPPATSVTIEEFGPEASFLGTRTVWLAFGTYHLVASAEGYENTRKEVLAKDQSPATVDIKLERPGKPPPKPVAPKPIRAPSKLPAIAVSGATVVSMVVSVIAFRKARDSADRLQFALDQETADDDASEVSKWNTVMGVTAGMAVVGATVSTLLWIKATRKTRVEVRPTGGGATMTLGGRF